MAVVQVDTMNTLSPQIHKKLQIAVLIDAGIRTAPAIAHRTGIPLRTVAYHLSHMSELGIAIDHVGGKKGGEYRIRECGIVDKHSATSLFKDLILEEELACSAKAKNCWPSYFILFW